MSRIPLLMLCSCATTSHPGDTVVECDGICSATLVVTFADGRDTFQAQLTGEGFPTLELACPDGVSAGGVGQATCTDSGFQVVVEDYEFPPVMELVVDGGDPIYLDQPWTEQTLCGTTCNGGSVTVY